MVFDVHSSRWYLVPELLTSGSVLGSTQTNLFFLMEPECLPASQPYFVHHYCICPLGCWSHPHTLGNQSAASNLKLITHTSESSTKIASMQLMQ
jgi:hypothetical protein